MAELHVSLIGKRRGALSEKGAPKESFLKAFLPPYWGRGRQRSSGWPVIEGLPFRNLAPIVEGEIIPRLLRAHRAAPAEHLLGAEDDVALQTARSEGEAVAIVHGAAEAFARRALAGELDRMIEFVVGLTSTGVSVETVYWDLIMPAARRLDAFWRDDRCSYVDVTMGVGVLQQVVLELSFKAPSTVAANGLSAYFTPFPGERRPLDLFMIEESFRRSGWQVCAENAPSAEEIVEAVSVNWFDLIGLSVDCDSHLDRLCEIIMSVRSASLNRALGVVLGGRMFLDRPGLFAIDGADAMACDGRLAASRASGAMGRVARRA